MWRGYGAPIQPRYHIHYGLGRIASPASATPNFYLGSRSSGRRAVSEVGFAARHFLPGLPPRGFVARAGRMSSRGWAPLRAHYCVKVSLDPEHRFRWAASSGQPPVTRRFARAMSPHPSPMNGVVETHLLLREPTRSMCKRPAA